MSDIVERLRSFEIGYGYSEITGEAATEIERLRAALKDARNYVEAVALNTPDQKKKRNYRDCVVRIDAALDEPKRRAE